MSDLVPSSFGAARLPRRDVLAGLALLATSSFAVGAAPLPRVAAMDYGLAEILLTLNAPFVGLSGLGDWDKWVVEPGLPSGVADLGSTQLPNFELLSQLRPDLILTTPYLDPFLPTLQRIGETMRVAIYDEGLEPLDRSVDATRRIGDRLDRRAEAERYLAAAEDEFAAIRARIAAIGPRPVLLLTFIDARHVRVFGGSGLYQSVLGRIGVPNAFAGETNYWGFATLGVERLATLGDAWLMLLDPLPPDALRTGRRSPLWTALPAVRAGRVSRLPPVLMFGTVSSALRCARLVAAEFERRGA